jgi:hypothetical protein
MFFVHVPYSTASQPRRDTSTPNPGRDDFSTPSFLKLSSLDKPLSAFFTYESASLVILIGAVYAQQNDFPVIFAAKIRVSAISFKMNWTFKFKASTQAALENNP